jgi:hypothetical protein
MLKITRDYYNFQLDIYLTKYGEDTVRHVPNILVIDKIDKLLEGCHPDSTTDVKSKFRLGLFLAQEGPPQTRIPQRLPHGEGLLILAAGRRQPGPK